MSQSDGGVCKKPIGVWSIAPPSLLSVWCNLLSDKEKPRLASGKSGLFNVLFYARAFPLIVTSRTPCLRQSVDNLFLIGGVEALDDGRGDVQRGVGAEYGVTCRGARKHEVVLIVGVELLYELIDIVVDLVVENHLLLG